MEKQKCPEIRFKGFNEAWEFKKLEEVGVFNPYSSLPQSFEYVDLESVVGTELIGSRNETIDSAPSRAQRLARKGDVFYQAVRPYQKNNYLFDLPYDNYIFSTGYIQIRPNINSRFLLNLVQKNDFVLRVLENCTGTSYPAINTTGLKNIDAFISSCVDEQAQLGNFFQNLDQSIALHEKKLVQTQNFKKAMLEKMFPKQGSKRPEIRLKGFNEDWKQFKLGDIASIVDRKDSVSTAPVMMISAASGFINQSEKYSSDNAGQSLAKYTVLQKGELAYNHGASKHKPYGACFALEVDEARIPFVYHCFNVGENNPYFTAIALNHFRIDGQLRKLISSGARMDGLLNISFDAYKTVEVMLPNKAEQDEIYNFFKSLDETLTLQQQKLRTLKNLKQAFLEKMFV